MNRFLKIAGGAMLVLLLVGVVLTVGKQAVPFPEGSESAARLEPGAQLVESYDELFVDDTRSTQATADYPGSDQRELDGTVWHPAKNSSGPYPLVVYSHGFSSTKDGGAYLGRQLASLGYVVVAVNYPLTNFAAPGGPFVKDVVNQPGDVSFLIDTLLAQSNTPDHVLAGMVDAQRIGVTGISLGGMTSTLAAFHPDTGDARIGAALSIASPTAFANEVFFRHREVPFLMLAADIDALVPYASNAAPIIAMVPNSQLITIAGGSHTGFSGSAVLLRWLNNPDLIGCMTVKSNIDKSMSEEKPWHDLIGREDQGIRQDAVNDLCIVDPLPEAMNVLRQHMITSVIVSSFFESQFAKDTAVRDSAAQFLSEVVSKELAEVQYQSSAL